MVRSRIMLALLPLAFASPASAQGTPEQRAACGPEAVRLCASSIPNVEKVSACLTEKRAELSTACRTVMDEAAAARQPQVAEAAEAPPAPAQPSPTGETSKPGSEPAASSRTASSGSAPLRFDARENQAQAATKPQRRSTASRRARSGSEADMAEARYWFRRVTGRPVPVDMRVFERISLGNLGSVLR